MLIEIEYSIGIYMFCAEGFKLFTSYNWKPRDKDKYLQRKVSVHGLSRTILFHRELTNAPKGKLVDHKDLNQFNNQKGNLRICEESGLNIRNRVKDLNKTSIYKGVSWKMSHRKWQCQIKINGHVKHLGLFTNELDAAKKYNEYAAQFNLDEKALNYV